jgi:hypothetical protein
MKKLLVVFLIILAFFCGYFLSQKYNFKIETKTPTLTVTPTKNQEPFNVGGDSDEHGCKASAGNSWCEVLKKCVRPWEEPCQEKNNNDEADIKAALVKKHGWNSDEIIVTVSDNNGSYARGGVKEKSSEVGGGMFLAMKKSGAWEIIFDGNGSVDCNQLKNIYQFPQSILQGVCD